MKRGMNTKGQGIMGLPFSMIFSIILIIFFVIAAIIAIKIFWNPNACAFSDQSQESLFLENLRTVVQEVWNSDRSDSDFAIKLPTKITKVCFMDTTKTAKGKNSALYDELQLYSQGKNNLYLYPGKKACEGFRGINLEHVNTAEITKLENPYCIENTKDPKFRIQKGFYDALVTIK